ARANPKHDNSETLAFVKANEGLVAWVAKARTAPRITVVTSHLAAVCYVASQSYPDQADAFMRQFKTGENLTVGHPVLTVRNRVFTDRGLNSGEKTELVVRAWNAFIEGRLLTKAVISADGPFPKIKGDTK